jgi:hypothetical protein
MLRCSLLLSYLLVSFAVCMPLCVVGNGQALRVVESFYMEVNDSR